MKYRLVCSDIDGTLVDQRGFLTKKNQDVIRKLENRGIPFAICSGRMLRAVELMAAYYHMAPFCVCSNGAVVYDMKKRQYLSFEELREEEMEHLLCLGEKYGCIIGINTAEGMIYNSSDCIEEQIYGNANLLYAGKAGKIELKRTKNYRDAAKGKKVAKVSFWTKNEEDYKKAKEEICGCGRYSVATAMPCNLEMTKKGITKWHGIEQIMERLNVKNEEVICFGDTMNDYEMVKNAGFGVCMENGMEELKEAADFITKSNEDSGVAFLLERCLKGVEMDER